ncbi:retroviral-like aspartic protease family protein [Erythrobacter sp. HL-111]|uniref:retroviral-like aspartic protease family protein n=1 Tax=Erythrobacter sp. HL-111 TaxID=1798193 RepID=UPI00087BA82B|nr:retroviral-like aspartic protease family protein [Erythrobacter sp. HL-111]SDT03539.1 Aspartyl protease [Erythrobacter sp. HL-111]
MRQRLAGALGLAAALGLAFPAMAAGTSTTGPGLLPPPPPFEQGPIGPDLAGPGTEVLALEEERFARFTVPVRIDGAGPFDFMIDTGSEATALTHEINIGLALPPQGSAILVGMASRRAVDLVEVGALTVGSHTVTGLTAPLLARAHVGADGIIGLDSLQDFRVLIDFREETIALENTREERGSSGGFEIIVRARPRLGQLLLTDAMVEGVRATVIIDTGAQMSLANNALRDRLRAKLSEDVTATDVNGVDIIGELAVVSDLTIEGLSLKGVPLTFADAPAFAALGLKDEPVISLGMQHLKIFDRVAIDFARQRVLFDLPRDVARALRRARRGTTYGVNH